MNAPIKPPKTSGTPATITLVPDSLTSEEKHMVACYRATALEWRSECVSFANTMSKMFPLVKALVLPVAPGIRLAESTGKVEPK